MTPYSPKMFVMLKSEFARSKANKIQAKDLFVVDDCVIIPHRTGPIVRCTNVATEESCEYYSGILENVKPEVVKELLEQGKKRSLLALETIEKNLSLFK